MLGGAACVGEAADLALSVDGMFIGTHGDRIQESARTFTRREAIREASIKANQFNGTDNYLVINDFEASIYRQFKIKDIPHYVIIGKNGKVISTNAPRPSEAKLVELLNKALL